MASSCQASLLRGMNANKFLCFAEKQKEIEQFRSLDAELSGTQGRRPSTLIDEKDFHAADVAV